MARPAKNPWGKTPRKRDNLFAEKREAVLRAAAKLFRERGYEGASLSELADILNITKPTIYYYVQSKEHLLLEILREAQEEILAFMTAADESTLNGYEKLRRIMIDYAQIIVSDYGATLARIWMRAIEPPGRLEVEKRVREADAIIHRILQEGVRDGSLRVSDPTVVLHALFGSLNWMAYWAKPNRRLNPQELAEAQTDILLEGIRGATPAAPKSAGRKLFARKAPAAAP